MLLRAATPNISAPTIKQVKAFGHFYCEGIFSFFKSYVLDFYLLFIYQFLNLYYVFAHKD